MTILIKNLQGKIEMSILALIEYELDFTLSHPMFVLDTCIINYIIVHVLIL